MKALAVAACVAFLASAMFALIVGLNEFASWVMAS